MHTLILSPRYTQDSIELWRAANDVGWHTLRLQGWHLSPEQALGSLQLYGEPFFGAAIAEQLELVLLEVPFDWLAGLPDDSLQRTVTAQPWKQVRDLSFPLFVKPADDKCFPAKVYAHLDELPDHVSPETPTLASTPVHWETEFRTFVLDGVVQTVSLYFRRGVFTTACEPGELAAAHRFAQEVLEHIVAPPACTLDVGQLSNGSWAVLEANPCWSSGLYDCDPRAVLPVIARACKREKELEPSDRKWVLTREPNA